tara:strand:- start:755 stop:1180 length:426 start_codon:yes stop_codon:yes gene_type:complete
MEPVIGHQSFSETKNVIILGLAMSVDGSASSQDISIADGITVKDPRVLSTDQRGEAAEVYLNIRNGTDIPVRVTEIQSTDGDIATFGRATVELDFERRSRAINRLKSSRQSALTLGSDRDFILSRDLKQPIGQSVVIGLRL